MNCYTVLSCTMEMRMIKYIIIKREKRVEKGVNMQEYGYFQKALSDFTYEVASGGAIRHLTDMGFTVKQIVARMDFPTPYEKVQKGVWERLIETGVILTEEPGSGGRQGEDKYLQRRREPVKKAKYVREYDQYGKASFRRVEEVQEEEEAICWREAHWEAGVYRLEELSVRLREKRKENGENRSYMSCEFGLTSWKEPERFQTMLEVLQERQREYLSGLPWERRRLYHRLDARMMDILLRLCAEGLYRGECFFLETKDRIMI